MISTFLSTVYKYKLEIAIFVLIGVIYFSLRLPNLTLQPIFADEAIYIRWAQVMKAEPTLRFLPLTDGKTPLYMWILMPMFKVFSDPLFAGRFLSVISGFFTLLGVFMLGWRVFNLKVGLIASLLYAIVPYAVFFDRMALVDSMLAAFTIWSIVIATLILKWQRLDLAMVLGYLLGGALLVKTPAMVNLLALPLTIIGYNFQTKKKWNLIKMLGCWLVATLIALAIYNILRLGPGFYQLSSRNADYVFSPAELVGRPLDPFIPHLGDILEWSIKLLNWPIFIFIIIGIVLVLLKKERLGLVILIWIAVPFFLQTAFLRTFTARYYLYMVPPLLVIGAYAVDKLIQYSKLSTKLMTGLFLAFISLTVIQTNYVLITNPEAASLPNNDRKGYFEDWTAGYGLKEIANFLKDQAKEGTVIVGTEGSFGTLPDGLQIYIEDFVHNTTKDKQIIVIGGPATISAQIRDAAKTYPTFYIANSSRIKDNLEGVTLIQAYYKAENRNKERDSILLFKVHSED